MATTYIQFTGRLKATSQEGILAEAQQVAISSSDNTNIKDYIDNKINEVKGTVNTVAGSVYRPKGSLTVDAFKALTSAAVGDVYNITEQFTLGGRVYPAYTNVACVKAFTSAVTPDDSYWDGLGGTVDLSPYAKTDTLNAQISTVNKSITDNVNALNTKISTAQSTANTANATANENKTSISGLTNRVTTLEGEDHVNKINSVKVDGTALAVDSSDKSVNINLSGKVDKVSGKGLSTNDFTDAYKTKLDGVAEGANNYVLPSATNSALGGVRVGAVDNGTMTSYQGASTTLRNGLLMCDVTDGTKNGALSKADYASFKKGITDLTALTSRVDDAESDINNLFSDKADRTDVVTGKGISISTAFGEIFTISVGSYGGSDYRSAEIGYGVEIGTNTTIGTSTVIGENSLIRDGVRIGTSANIGENVFIGIDESNFNAYSVVSIGYNVEVRNNVSIDHNTRIGQNVFIGSVVFGSNLSEGVAIGKGVQIGTNDSVLIYGDTTIGTRVFCEEDIYISQGVDLGKDVSIGEKSILRKGVYIGEEVQIGNEDGNVFIGGDTRIGTAYESERQVKIEKNVGIASGVYLEIANANKDLVYGTSVKVTVAKQSDVTALQNRVAVLESLLKLA